MICMGVLVFNVIWGLASLVGLTVDCVPETILTTAHARQCPEQVSFIQYEPLSRRALV